VKWSIVGRKSFGPPELSLPHMGGEPSRVIGKNRAKWALGKDRGGRKTREDTERTNLGSRSRGRRRM